jgi:hypothetical protein
MASISDMMLISKQYTITGRKANPWNRGTPKVAQAEKGVA